MIRFALICEHEHEFEGWFRSNDDFDTQKKRGFVDCPTCGSHKVQKALMAPAVSTARKQETIALAMGEAQKQALAQLKAMAEKVRENADYVGDKFAEEARKIHFGESDPRGIYGEATLDEAKSLAEDGVEFMPIPVFPDDRN
ncbi:MULTISPECIES: DUF1178 family protein [Mesorhizobium]|uniref:DUF1178 family protein n=1 Tax=Mesorhizobium TaxID=68287 RepID=UPI0003CFD35C|nr:MULTISPECIES: DUF1178 family protein [Mesorhizobium]RUU15907.1 DUF1178 family protein [Mesorhizobium sp. M7A.T.Ca.TU.009.01.3.2]RUU49620.1 DUF1178 family protein [Mesorhizobium sp. M7A.T.Ca.TU.009.01.1.1]RUU85666.1 DUF1178 family protein [Mesorhizobium sp. M7A.T.Ca.TU.009.01.1.2]RUV11982.1 DUF1178 family protein [Mesorhizobium sp. M7A.T.Ca.TU.009.01.3.1]RUV49893.1 DUF1178 family protein [Mesorhizobium sp. M7A.F.Ca.MR.228.00.0.0]RVB24310.1 DUF1178 family protein [Mesorhizobium sp. M7A.F.Ca.